MPRPHRKLDPNLPIHVVARCNNREPFPVSLEECWSIFSDYLHLINGVFGIKILAFVMMSNHIHLIILDPEMKLPRAMRIFMRSTSMEMARLSGRINKIWGGTYFSSVIENPIHFLHAYKYCYRNPVAAGVVERVEDYPWSTLQILLGKKRGCIPMGCDDTLFNGVEQTLCWLNESFLVEDALAIKKALCKSTFQIASSNSHRKSHLHDASSVPFSVFDASNTEKV